MIWFVVDVIKLGIWFDSVPIRGYRWKLIEVKAFWVFSLTSSFCCDFTVAFNPHSLHKEKLWGVCGSLQMQSFNVLYSKDTDRDILMSHLAGMLKRITKTWISHNSQHALFFFFHNWHYFLEVFFYLHESWILVRA